MDPRRNNPVFHTDYLALHRPAAAQNYATSSYNEDLSPAPFSQNALIVEGVTQINDPQPKNYDFLEGTLIPGADLAGGWLPLVPVEIGYPGPIPTTAYSTSWEGLVPDQPSFPWTENGHQNNLYGSQPLGLDLLGLELETTPVVQIPYQQLQCHLLQFFMANLFLLNTVTNSTPEAMAIIQVAFVEDIYRSGLTPDLSDINKMFHQFEPTIGSWAIRQESDSRKTTKVNRIECPFQFCPGHFTRIAGLKNHLSAHFSLAPNQCPHCGKYYSDVSFRRHVGSCRTVDSSNLNAQSFQT